METLVEALTRFGLPGVVVAIFLFLYVKKDQELKRERDARIADAQAFNKLALDLQAKALETANRLTEVFEELRKGPYSPPRRTA